MNIFLHRINSIGLDYLKHSNGIAGVECDVRYNGTSSILAHDPTNTNNSENPVSLENFAANYRHKNIILNFKETGLELNEVKKLKQYIPYIYCLDMPFPAIYKFCISGLGNHIMMRASEYESVNLKFCVKYGIKWIWLDSFNKYWFDDKYLINLKSEGLNICLVSNELQSRPLSKDYQLIQQLREKDLIDAVCTKHPDFYNGTLSSI